MLQDETEQSNSFNNVAKNHKVKGNTLNFSHCILAPNKWGGLKKARRKITELKEIIKTSMKLENKTGITNILQIFIEETQI